MKKKNVNDQVRIPDISRRNFISSCSACAACLTIAPLTFVSSSCASANSNKKLRIRILYSLHAAVQAQPDWPNIGHDFNPAMERINKALVSHFKDIECSYHLHIIYARYRGYIQQMPDSTLPVQSLQSLPAWISRWMRFLRTG